MKARVKKDDEQKYKVSSESYEIKQDEKEIDNFLRRLLFPLKSEKKINDEPVDDMKNALELAESEERKEEFNHIANYVFSFTEDEDFRKSSRFERYVSDATKNLNVFLGRIYCKKEESFLEKSKRSKITVHMFVYNSLMRRTYAFIEEIKDEGHVFEDSDGIGHDYDYNYHGLWDYYAMISNPKSDVTDVKLAKSELEELESLMRGFMNANLSGILKSKSFKYILKIGIEKFCLRYIRYRCTKDGSIDEKNFMRLAKLEDPCDLIWFINWLEEYVWQEAINMITTIRIIALRGDVNDARLLWKIKELNEKNEKLEVQLEKEQQNTKNVTLKLNKKIDELIAEKGKIEQDVYKKEQQKTHDLKQRIKKQKSDYEELQGKYERLLEFVEELEDDSETVEEEPLYSEADLQEIRKKLEDKRIVFVRRKSRSGYLIMKKIESFFPNVRLVCSANEINYKTTDVVVILTRYIEHGTYWKARDSARAAGVTCLHTDKASIGGICKQIMDAIEANN